MDQDIRHMHITAMFESIPSALKKVFCDRACLDYIHCEGQNLCLKKKKKATS